MFNFRPPQHPYPRSVARYALAPTMVLLSMVLGCGEAADPSTSGPDSTEVKAQLPEQVIYDYDLVESDAGVKQWVLESDIMYQYRDRKDVDLVRVDMDFFEEGARHATLLADSGVVNVKTRDVHVWGHVVVTNREGWRLRTSELFYTSTDGFIRNDVYNVVNRGEDVTTGIGLEAKPDLTYLVIKNQVAGVISDDAGDDRPRARGTR